MPDPFARQHRNWAEWFGPEWDAVRIATAARARAAMQEWGVVDARPFGSGGVGYVYRARLRTGDAVVLKVEPVTTAWTAGAADRALVVWARAGLAPRVLAARDDGRTLLLEPVTPGTELGDVTAGSVGASFPVIADVARRLRHADRTAADGPFPTIAAHAESDGWRRALTRRCPAAGAELEALLALPATDLIHNDLYQDNVLRAGDDWVVIDPKPVLADPHAECFAFLAAAEHVTDVAVVAGYARTAGLSDPQLLARWVRIRAIIAIAQHSESAEPSPDSARWIAHLHALARRLEPVCR